MRSAVEPDVQSRGLRIRSRCLREFLDPRNDVLVVVEGEELDLDDLPLRIIEARLNAVDENHARSALEESPFRAELRERGQRGGRARTGRERTYDTDRSSALDPNEVALLDSRIDDAVIRCREDVGEEESRLVRDARGNLEEVRVGVGNARVISLVTSEAAAEVIVGVDTACELSQCGGGRRSVARRTGGTFLHDSRARRRHALLAHVALFAGDVDCEKRGDQPFSLRKRERTDSSQRHGLRPGPW